MSLTMEQIHRERPVTNTFHNLVQTLSIKIDSAARYGLYEDDAREEGNNDCAQLFSQLAENERERIAQLRDCLKDHISE